MRKIMIEIDPYDLGGMEKTLQQSTQEEIMLDDIGLDNNGSVFAQDALADNAQSEPWTTMLGSEVSSSLIDSWLDIGHGIGSELNASPLPQTISFEADESIVYKPYLSYFWQERERQRQLIDVLQISIDNSQ